MVWGIMVIKSISLKNYRNFSYLNLDFDPDINIFYGENAQGKTNILEAVYVSSTTKSHRGAKDRELIHFTQEEAHICTILEKKGMIHKIDIHLRQNKTKGVAIDGIPIKKASDLFGVTHFVFFSPEDLNIVKRGPAERRRFIDTELCQIDKVYLYNLSNYNKLVLQRNKLLKEYSLNQDGKDILDILDLQMVQYGSKIIHRRENFIKKLADMMNRIHFHLSGGRERVILQYEPNADEKSFSDLLAKNRERDIKLKTTNVGPHRDDISFFIDDIDIRKFGSQGQQRTAALSLKLSEIEILKESVQDTPILLLDDVLSELDSNRQNYLLNHIQNIQTLITCTGLDNFMKNQFSVYKIYKVSGGKVTVEN